MAEWSTAGLWLAVLGSGIYHGVNPGMGWPLAVSAAWMGKGRGELLPALGALAVGHFGAMVGVLLPFAAMAVLVDRQMEIRLAAGLLVVAAGVVLLFNRRHPRFLARIRPTQLALWSFAAAMAHGSGLMLVPIYLGLCRPDDLDSADRAANTLMAGNAAMAVSVATAHTAMMLAAGGAIAFAVYEWLGPTFIARSWFNMQVVWPLSLILVGGLGAAAAVTW